LARRYGNAEVHFQLGQEQPDWGAASKEVSSNTHSFKLNIKGMYAETHLLIHNNLSFTSIILTL